LQFGAVPGVFPHTFYLLNGCGSCVPLGVPHLDSFSIQFKRVYQAGKQAAAGSQREEGRRLGDDCWDE